MFRVARKIRVGRETGNTHIFFLGLRCNRLHTEEWQLDNFVYVAHLK